jgi:hypothetical protein
LILFPKRLTLKLVPTSQNKIYEHKIDFKLRERERERERLHLRKQQIGWKRETDSAREQGREREKNKSGLKISNWQELGGFTSVQNFLQAP